MLTMTATDAAMDLEDLIVTLAQPSFERLTTDDADAILNACERYASRASEPLERTFAGHILHGFLKVSMERLDLPSQMAPLSTDEALALASLGMIVYVDALLKDEVEVADALFVASQKLLGQAVLAAGETHTMLEVA
jgi:hypothetical protein